MRRWPTIELVVTPEACLASDLQAVLQARSMQTVSSSSDSDAEGDFFTGAGVMDPTVVEGVCLGDCRRTLCTMTSVITSIVSESVKLVGLSIERQPGVTIGQQLEKAYRQAKPAISAYQQRRQKRRDYLSEVQAIHSSAPYTGCDRCRSATTPTFSQLSGPLCWAPHCSSWRWRMAPATWTSSHATSFCDSAVAAMHLLVRYL